MHFSWWESNIIVEFKCDNILNCRNILAGTIFYINDTLSRLVYQTWFSKWHLITYIWVSSKFWLMKPSQVHDSLIQSMLTYLVYFINNDLSPAWFFLGAWQFYLVNVNFSHTLLFIKSYSMLTYLIHFNQWSFSLILNNFLQMTTTYSV